MEVHMRATFAFGVGAVIGAGLAIFFAPKIGKQIQEGLGEMTGSIERGQAKVREIADQAIRVADQAKDRVQRVQDAVDAGVRAFKEVTNFTNRSSS
jgi:gas vesicle protein